MVRHMIPREPDFSLRNRFGGNALIPACERAHVDTVKLLLTTKIDANHVNNLGWTCLLEIVILGDGGARHVEVGKLVLAAGADANIADKDGVSPLAHARRKGQREIGRLIEAAGGEVGGSWLLFGSRRDRVFRLRRGALVLTNSTTASNSTGPGD